MIGLRCRSTTHPTAIAVILPAHTNLLGRGITRSATLHRVSTHNRTASAVYISVGIQLVTPSHLVILPYGPEGATFFRIEFTVALNSPFVGCRSLLLLIPPEPAIVLIDPLLGPHFGTSQSAISCYRLVKLALCRNPLRHLKMLRGATDTLNDDRLHMVARGRFGNHPVDRDRKRGR